MATYKSPLTSQEKRPWNETYITSIMLLDPAFKKPQKHNRMNASIPPHLENSYSTFKTQLKYSLFLCGLKKRIEGVMVPGQCGLRLAGG